MKRITKNNLIKFIGLKKEYLELKEEEGLEEKKKELLTAINGFVEVINKDKKYYNKLTSFNFTSKELEYLL